MHVFVLVLAGFAAGCGLTGLVWWRARASGRRESAGARAETEHLYHFSQLLLQSGDMLEMERSIPLYLTRTFGGSAAALYLTDRREIYRSGDPAAVPIEWLRAAVGAPARVQDGCALASVRLGVRPIGSFAVCGGSVSSGGLETLGGMIAIALERSRAVEQLGLTEAARENERLKSVLLDSVAHDFRTPLTSIKAAITGLLAGVPLDPEPRRELLHVIDQETDRLNGLVEEAAEMARLEAGDLELHPQPEAVAGLIQDALEECRNLLASHQLQLDLPAQLPPALADAASVCKAMVRILENAALYSPPGLPIMVRARAAGAHIEIAVADHGPGVDAGERDLIFTKFYRGRSQRSTSRGSGMGLAIARGIAVAHGGALRLDPEPGFGSVFVLALPTARPRDLPA